MIQEKLQDLEIIKPHKDGWYFVKWKPIKNATYNLYITDDMFSKMLGIKYYRIDSYGHNHYKGFTLEIGLWLWNINFWIIYNILLKKSI